MHVNTVLACNHISYHELAERVNKFATTYFQISVQWELCQGSCVRGQPPNPRDFSGMPRVFKEFVGGRLAPFGETEAGAAGTQPAKG